MKAAKLIFLVAALLVSNSNSKSEAQQTITAPSGSTPEIMNDFNDGNRLLASGKTPEAIEKLKRVTAKLPDFGIGHLQLGQAYFRMNKNNEALAELQMADRLSPNNEHVMAFIGQIYQLLGRNAEAIASYRKYLKAFPSGQYAGQLGLMEKTLALELSRTGGESSAGMDNYLKEAIAGGGGGGKWDKAKMPLKVFIADGSGIENYKEVYKQMLRQAFLSWSEASANEISFSFVESPQAADISCRWTANLKDLVNPVEGGQALVAKSLHGQVIKAEILILTRNPSLPPFPDSFVRHVCLHEVGHSLGLSGHSSQPGDIMFAAASYESATGILSQRDKKTMLMHYAK